MRPAVMAFGGLTVESGDMGAQVGVGKAVGQQTEDDQSVQTRVVWVTIGAVTAVNISSPTHGPEMS